MNSGRNRDFVLMNFMATKAFVPECSCEVVYEWARAAKVFKKEYEIDDVTIVTMNDPYVVTHFAKKLDYEDRLNFIADWDGRLNDVIDCRQNFELELGIKPFKFFISEIMDFF